MLSAAQRSESGIRVEDFVKDARIRSPEAERVAEQLERQAELEQSSDGVLEQMPTSLLDDGDLPEGPAEWATFILQNLINAINAAFNQWDGSVNYEAYQCTGDSVIDTLLDRANVASVSQLDQSQIYNWKGFCESLRAFIPGAPTDYPTGEPVTPTQETTSQPEVNPTADPTAPPTADATVAPTDNTDGSCYKYEKYTQCGGDGFVQKTGAEFDGCSECPAGTQCFARSQWYHGCTEACPGGDWLCAQEGETPTPAPETTTAAPVTTTAAPEVETTTPAPETSTGVAPGSCPNAEYDTCGGEGQVIGSGSGQWSGESCCQEGLECVVESQWYHVCKSARRMELVAPQ